MGKFYFVAEGYTPNTASTNRCLSYIKQFSKRGIETDVVYFVSDRNNSLAPELEHIRYHYYWATLSFLKNDNLKNFLYLFLYVYLFCMKLKKSDIVYAYGCDKLITLLAKRKDIKKYQERTEHPDVSFFNVVNKNRYKSCCQYLDGVFVISRGLKEYYISLGVDEYKVTIINIVVDFSRFEKLEKENAEPYIVYCGTVSNGKDGVDQLIRAFSLTACKHKDIKLYIVGRVESSATDMMIRNLVRELGVEENVVFKGAIDANLMPQMLKNALICALDRPANMQAQYGFPTKLGEYLATGNVVVVSAVGDIPCFLKDEESALISIPDNIESFSSKLDYAIEHPDHAKEIGAKGREIAFLNFNAEMETNKIIETIF